MAKRGGGTDPRRTLGPYRRGTVRSGHHGRDQASQRLISTSNTPLQQVIDRWIEVKPPAPPSPIAPKSDPDQTQPDSGNTTPRPLDTPVPRTVTVGLATLTVNYPQTLLHNEADVDDYLQALRETLMNEITAGKRVSR